MYMEYEWISEYSESEKQWNNIISGWESEKEKITEKSTL